MNNLRIEENKWILDLEFQKKYFFINSLRNLHNLYYYDLNDLERNSITSLSPDQKLTRAYILKYVPESYTTIHRDSPDDSMSTAVTCLELSDDVWGGYAIHIQDTIPHALHIQPGETLWYPQNHLHGVSMVTQGHRTVLITWWVDN